MEIKGLPRATPHPCRVWMGVAGLGQGDILQSSVAWVQDLVIAFAFPLRRCLCVALHMCDHRLGLSSGTTQELQPRLHREVICPLVTCKDSRFM